MAEDFASGPSSNNAAASASEGSQAWVAHRNMAVDQSRNVTVDQSQQIHYHDVDRDIEALPLVRRITADDVPGFVGRADELDWLARLMAPDAPRGGPLVLYPANDQPGIGVTGLAVQAASRAVAAGWFGGGAVLVSPHAGGEQRQASLARTLANVLAALGEPLERRAGGAVGQQAAYQRAMEARAAVGKPVLIVVEEVWETDAQLIAGLEVVKPHRMLLTAWKSPEWLFNRRSLQVRYLTEDESVELMTAALSPHFSRRPPDPPAHLRALARCCGGVARALRVAADELAAWPELSIARLMQALANSYDRGDGDPGAPDGQPPSLTRALATMVRLLTPVWGPAPEPVVGGRRVIGRRALLSWVRADQMSGRPSAWDIVADPGMGKSTLLGAAQAELASAGATAVLITMEVPADSYERRRAGSGEPLVIELARTQLCTDVARAVGEKLAGAENLAIAEHIYLADQDIQEVLATRPEDRPDLNVGDQLILSGTGGEVPPLDPAISEAYAERVRAIRMELGRRLAETLSRPSAATGRLAMLIDNMHLVEDAACREWLADLFFDRLGAVTVAARRPGDQAFCEAALTYHLSDFTLAETMEYLTLVGGLKSRWVDKRMLNAFMGATRGTPQAVAVQCDGLTGHVQGAISDALDQSPLSPAWSTDLGRSLAASARQLVAQACQEVLGRDLPIVLDFLVVLRHVNAGLLARVLTGEGITRDEADLLAAKLAEYSIMTGSDDDDPESFRLHDRIRWYSLAEMPPDTVRRRHERAEHVYAELVAGYEPEWDPQAEDAFGAWARFESPKFQAVAREWLFHAMRSQGSDLSQRTGVRITQIFLEAFWWWGFYLPFRLCEQLLREFHLISADKSDADRQWLEDLRTLYQNYRWGYVYNVDAKRDWSEVGTAVLGLRWRVGLSKSKPMDPGRHTIDVITNVYQAQATAFRDPGGDPQAAAALFAEARAAVRRSVAAGNRRHAWYDAWIVYFTADMWSSCGRPDEASAALRELDALALADLENDLTDRDLAARKVTVEGEVYLMRGDYARAIDACARAALLVYAYHVSQETPAQPPNEYTYTWQVECATRASACLAAVREHDPAAWRAGILRMCATFAPYWRLAGGSAGRQYAPSADPSPADWPPADWPPVDGPALPEGILPPLPDRRYLGQLDSPFARLARRLVATGGPTLDKWVPFQEPESEEGPPRAARPPSYRRQPCLESGARGKHHRSFG